MATHKKGVGMVGLGLFDGVDAPSPTPKPATVFQQADAYLASLGYPEPVIREFNLFLGHYCKRRGKPSMEDVKAWVAILERHREWKFDFDDVAYVLKWSRSTDKYYVAIPPEMAHGGQYWFDKAKAQPGGKAKKVY